MKALQTAITMNNNGDLGKADINCHTSKHSLKLMNPFTKLEDSKIGGGFDDDLFYDSDPEEYCRRVVTNCFNHIDLNEISSKSRDKKNEQGYTITKSKIEKTAIIILSEWV